jgi:hypothetical protein
MGKMFMSLTLRIVATAKHYKVSAATRQHRVKLTPSSISSKLATKQSQNRQAPADRQVTAKPW